MNNNIPFKTIDVIIYRCLTLGKTVLVNGSWNELPLQSNSSECHLFRYKSTDVFNTSRLPFRIRDSKINFLHEIFCIFI